MFPKAHAAAYVMMAWRIAWFKVFIPLAYYAAFFSIRATAFSYETMCMGRDRLEYYLAELRKKRVDEGIKKMGTDSIRDMRIVQEMYARGFEFLPIDIYRSHANRFQIIDGKLLPPLNSMTEWETRLRRRWWRLQSRENSCPRMISVTAPRSVRQSLSYGRSGAVRRYSPVQSVLPCLMWCDCLTLLFTRYCPVRLL